MSEETIARNIMKLRRQRKITLEKLAELTGLTKGYLSKIERSNKAPPYSTLNKIAIALGVDAAFFLDDGPHEAKRIKIAFTKRARGKSIRSVGSLSEGSLYGYGYEALAFDKRGKNMEPFIIEPAFDEEAIFQHEGEEFMYVLEGKHELIYGEQHFIMEKGDCVYFDADVPHTGKSLGKRKAKLLAVMFNYRRG
ncbi:MAG: XRE family transcriptional regulator [Thermodesulfobacteriota bacterium]